MEARVLRQHSYVQTSKHLDLSGSGRLSGLRLAELPPPLRLEYHLSFPGAAPSLSSFPFSGDLYTQNPDSFPPHPLSSYRHF